MPDRLPRGAVIGLGNVALNGHLPEWRSRRDCAIVAATDVRSEAKALLETHLPGARWYESTDALYEAEDLDFVDICTPPATHAAVIGRALECGLHVLCEKPLVSKAADLKRVARLARSRGRALHTVHNWLEAPPVRKVAALVAEGIIGQVRKCSWATIRNRPASAVSAENGNWRTDPETAGGGILVDHGWHAFYVVCAWMRATPTGIRALLERRRFRDWAIEDTATVHLEFPDGEASIVLTWAGDKRQNQARLLGTEGEILLADDTVIVRRSGGKVGASLPDREFPCGSALSSGSHHPEWFSGVVDRFLRALRDGSPADAGNLSEASLCARLIDLAQASSRGGSAMQRV